MITTDRTTHMAWADQIDAERRACTRGTTWAELDAAIRAHMTHDAGCLADIGTECLMEQALLPTQPAALDAEPEAHPQPDVGPGAGWAWLAAAVVLASAGASALFPWGWALPLP